MSVGIKASIALLFSFLALFSSSFVFAGSPPAAQTVFGLTVQRNGAEGLTLRWTIAPGNYIYRDSLRAKLNGRELPLALPKGESKDDPNFGVVEVYHGIVEGTLTDLPSSGDIDVVSRGCAEQGICYPPLTRSVDIATLAVRDVKLALGGANDANSEAPNPEKAQSYDQSPQTLSAGITTTLDGDLASVLSGDLLPMLAAFLRQGANRTWCKDDARQQMVRQIRCELLVSQLVRIGIGLDQFLGFFPDRIVAGKEDHAPFHQRRDRVVGWGVNALRVLEVLRVRIRSLGVLNEGIGLELVSRQFSQLVFIPDRLV